MAGQTSKERSERRAELRRERIASCLCIYCGIVPPREGLKSCDSCNERQKEITHKSYKKHERKVLDANRARRFRLKQEVLAHYGGQCACCAETTWEFLTLDHINEDGAAHRRELFGTQKAGSSQMYRWAKKNGYPAIFRVLCFNCNVTIFHYGTCPHQRKHEKEAVSA